MAQAIIGGDIFESRRDLIDATSNHRPDTSWHLIDRSGHSHQWFVNGEPARSYSPSLTYDTPSLKWVFDRWGYWEDGERYAIGHHECRECGEHIERGFTADTTTQYVAGLLHCSINGEPVSCDEFERRLKDAQRHGT